MIMTREEREQVTKEYHAYTEKYKNIVEEKYSKLSPTQKRAMTYILIADSLTAEQMKEHKVYSMFSTVTQKVENDLILTQESSATLRALEKKGIIQIIHDGKLSVDTIKLIK